MIYLRLVHRSSSSFFCGWDKAGLQPGGMQGGNDLGNDMVCSPYLQVCLVRYSAGSCLVTFDAAVHPGQLVI
jgi:hypothetical protein